jgi:deoxyribodipyrimidine photo-lyase
MPKPYQRALFLFRRDLRLADNSALARAAELAEEVVPCFVFDPRQADPEENPYFCANAFELMLESLEDLDRQLREAGGRLYLYRIDLSTIISKYIGKTENGNTGNGTTGKDASGEPPAPTLVVVNRDYTPFSKRRDGEIQALCAARGVRFLQVDDLLLTPPDRVRTGDGTPYRVFTPFWKAAREHHAEAEPVPEPAGVPNARWATGDDPDAISLEDAWELLPGERNPDLWVHGGRARGLEILDSIERFADYKETRETPADENGTTGLSAHNKFGTVSIREVYHRMRSALGADHELLRQLYWRDFFTRLAWFHPWVFGAAFKRVYDRIEWEDDEELFAAWRAGRTGFPIVDAGMRQLEATGFMHNRVRMITASFLVKDLHVDWRKGERHFANHLVDYDPAVNNGNWQWAASTGADAQPWFRIFNPWRQQKRFDPDCRYVKRWVPELRDLEPKAIHGLETGRPRSGPSGGSGTLDYPEPVVHHKERAARAKEMFRAVTE